MQVYSTSFISKVWFLYSIAAIQSLGAVYGLYLIADLLLGNGRGSLHGFQIFVFGFMLIFFMFSLASGVLLLFNHKNGYIGSLVSQIFQTLSVSFYTLTYSVYSFFMFQIFVSGDGNIGFKFDLSTVYFKLTYNPIGYDFFIAINLTSTFFTYVIYTNYKRKFT